MSPAATTPDQSSPEAERAPHVPGELVDHRLDGLPIYYMATTQRTDVDSLLVLMPAARTVRSPRRPIYSRWSWNADWPHSHVMAFADPVLELSDRLNDAWYMHPEHDVIRAFAGLVAEHARERGIPNERILVYGSSLGGFGAIGLAAHLPGARAVAEVPQIEFTHWMPLAVTFVEEELTGPIEDHRAKHPEQVSLPDRIRTAGHVPQATIFPNPEDLSFEDQQEFVAWANDTDLPRTGHASLEITSQLTGHAIMTREDLVPLLVPLT